MAEFCDALRHLNTVLDDVQISSANNPRDIRRTSDKGFGSKNEQTGKRVEVARGPRYGIFLGLEKSSRKKIQRRTAQVTPMDRGGSWRVHDLPSPSGFSGQVSPDSALGPEHHPPRRQADPVISGKSDYLNGGQARPTPPDWT